MQTAAVAFEMSTGVENMLVNSKGLYWGDCMHQEDCRDVKTLDC